MRYLLPGTNFRNSSVPASGNVLLTGREDGFDMRDMPAVDAETLTAHFFDVDQDGWQDLIVGNDFVPGDVLYRNDGSGTLVLEQDPTGLLPHGARTTMAITSADIDNDLVPELYFGQKAWDRRNVGDLSPDDVCAEIGDDDARLACVRHYRAVELNVNAQRRSDLDQCARWPFPDNGLDYIALQAFQSLNFRNPNLANCEQFDPGWPLLLAACQFRSTVAIAPNAQQQASQLPSVAQRNILFSQDEQGPWVNVAPQMGLEYGGWVWNAQFADLDQDSFQDLFIATGHAAVRL